MLLERLSAATHKRDACIYAFFLKKLYIKKNNEKVCNCGLSSANNLYSKGQKCTFTAQTADTYFAAVHAVSEQ